MARELAQLALLSEAYKRLAALPAPLQDDVKAAIGWVVAQDDVLAAPGHADLWQVCGNHSQDDERISRRTCYLRGRASGRWAALHQYCAGAQALPPPLLPGTWHQGTLHFYPGALPLRVVFGADVALAPAPAPVAAAAATIPALLAGYAAALASQPFLESFPMLLAEVVPVLTGEQRFAVRDSDGAMLPVDARFRHGWHLHALAGAAAVTIFGLWNGYSFLPLTVFIQDRVYPFDPDGLR